VQIITIFVAKFYAKRLKIFTAMEQYHISIYSNFEEFWRYNVVVMASVKRDGEEIQRLKAKDEVAPAGAELLNPPLGYKTNRIIELDSEPATELTLYIYILPHTFPRTLSIADTPPFDLRVEVMYGSERRYAHTLEIDQWSGANIILNL
jgi:hypothetical protein